MIFQSGTGSDNRSITADGVQPSGTGPAPRYLYGSVGFAEDIRGGRQTCTQWGPSYWRPFPAADNIHVPTHWDAVGRIALAWALTFALGFERQIRGAMAGDRTFSLLGAATALIGVLAGNGASTILAGAVTGIGFIGGGLCFRQTVQEHEVLHGITTAASIFACSAIGAACGLGLVKESIAATAATLLTLELRHIPLIRTLDARRWNGLVHHDEHVHSQILKRGSTSSSRMAEARVATADTADSDAVVLDQPGDRRAAGGRGHGGDGHARGAGDGRRRRGPRAAARPLRRPGSSRATRSSQANGKR